MPNYKTLIVAPETNLTLAPDEVQQVVNLLSAKLLRGAGANVHGLLNILAEPFDVIWFATHGDENGIYLNDGLLSTSDLTTLARSCGASLVVLNTCTSRNVALGIYDELRIKLVCTVKKVPDRTAFITGVILARGLSNGLGYREAYEAAKPGQNATYLFLPEEESYMPPIERPGKMDEDIQTLAVLVRRLEIIVTGNSDYNVEGLAPTVRMLTKKVDQLLIDFGVMKANQLFNRRVLLGVSFLCTLLLFATSILVYQRWGV